MPMLDVFHDDVFGVVSLTESINKLPYVPSRLGKMGLFKKGGVPTLTVVVEEQRGKLMIVPTAARGSHPNVLGGKGRNAKAFSIPHVPLEAAVMADDVQGVRAFGSESDVEVASTLVNDKLQEMRQAIELTHEWYRIGAVQGIVLDADAGFTELFNWFDAFGITEEVVGFDFTDEDDVKLKAAYITRHIEDALGMTPYSYIHCLCGSDMFDSLITSAGVKEAFDRYQDSKFFRDNQVRSSFEYAGITWEEYRGAVGDTKFIADTDFRFFPVGVPGLFTETYGPANFMETVNTVGKPVYAKQEPRKWNEGIDLHTQTNTITMCTRPAVLVRGYDEAVGS